MDPIRTIPEWTAPGESKCTNEIVGKELTSMLGQRTKADRNQLFKPRLVFHFFDRSIASCSLFNCSGSSINSNSFIRPMYDSSSCPKNRASLEKSIQKW